MNVSSIIFDKVKVDETVDLLSSIDNDLTHLTDELNSAASQIINARGFQEYIGGFSFDNLEQYVIEAEDATNNMIANIVGKEISIMEYSGDESGVQSVLASLSPTVRSIMGVDIDSSNALGADDSDANILFRTAATVGTASVSLLEGLGQVVEAGVDLADMAATGVSSIFKMAGNLFSGKSIMDGVGEMWEKTAARVSEKKCESIFNNFYENNSLGKTLKKNSYGFDIVRSVGSGVGYAIGLTSLAVLTCGAGTAAAGGGIGVAQIGTMAGALGVARGSEKAWADGASVGKGLLYGLANGAWEGAQWAVGAKIGQQGGWGNKVADKLFSKGAESASKLAVSMTRIGMDTVDTAVEGFVQPALDMIYKDYYINENGEKVKFDSNETLTSKYKKLFDDAGGWSNVGTQALMGGFGSAFGEMMDATKLLKTADGKAEGDVDIDSSTKVRDNIEPDARTSSATADMRATRYDILSSKNLDVEGRVDTDIKTNTDVPTIKVDGDSTRVDASIKPEPVVQASNSVRNVEVDGRVDTSIKVNNDVSPRKVDVDSTRVDTNNTNNVIELGPRVDNRSSDVDIPTRIQAETITQSTSVTKNNNVIELGSRVDASIKPEVSNSIRNVEVGGRVDTSVKVSNAVSTKNNNVIELGSRVDSDVDRVELRPTGTDGGTVITSSQMSSSKITSSVNDLSTNSRFNSDSGVAASATTGAVGLYSKTSDAIRGVDTGSVLRSVDYSPTIRDSDFDMGTGDFRVRSGDSGQISLEEMAINKGQDLVKRSKLSDGSTEIKVTASDGTVKSYIETQDGVVKAKPPTDDVYFGVADGTGKVNQSGVSISSMTKDTNIDSIAEVDHKVIRHRDGSVESISLKADGTEKRITLYEDGQVKSEIKYPSGVEEIVYKDKNGQVVSSRGRFDEQSKLDAQKRINDAKAKLGITSVDSSGHNLEHSIEKLDDGSMIISSKHKNGVVEVVRQNSDGNIVSRDFEYPVDSGQNIKHISETRRADGCLVKKMEKTDGVIRTEVVDSNGRLMAVQEKGSNDLGFVSKESVIDYENGHINQRCVYADGREVYTFETFGGDVKVEEFRADGSFTVTEGKVGKEFSSISKDISGDIPSTDAMNKRLDGKVNSQTQSKVETKTEPITEKNGMKKNGVTIDEGTGTRIRESVDKNVEILENGRKKVTIESDSSTDVVVYDKSGKMVEKTSTLTAGGQVHEVYQPDGKIIRDIYDTDGTFKHNLLDKNNNVIEQYIQKPDGTIRTMKKLPNGDIESAVKHVDGSFNRQNVGVDGTIKNSVFDKNGRLVSDSTTASNGTLTKNFYDESGKIVESYNRSFDGNETISKRLQNGDFETTVRNVDGSSSKKIASVDGTTKKINYDKSGRLVSDSTTASNGTIKKNFYDENGRLVESYERSFDGTETMRRRMQNGDVEKTIRNVDGSSSKKITSVDGTVRENSYNKNGLLLDEYIDSPKKGVTIRRSYDINGRIISDSTISIDGSIKKNLYDKDGRIIESYNKSFDGIETTKKLLQNGDVETTIRNVDGSSSKKIASVDGIVRKNSYDKNGLLLDEHVDNPKTGVSIKKSYDKNGRLIERVDKYISGTDVHTKYMPEGDSYTQIKLNDGTSQIKHSKVDGSSEIQFYNSDGRIFKRQYQYTDGTVVTDTYRADGTSREIKYKNGAVVRESYDANGKKIGQDTTQKKSPFDKLKDHAEQRKQQRRQQTDQGSQVHQQRHQQGQNVQQRSLPRFNNQAEVISYVSNPLSDENLDKISDAFARAIETGEKPYEALVHINCKQRKIAPTAAMADIYNKKFSANEFEMKNQYNYFTHVRTSGFDYNEITGRLYLNMFDYNDAFRFSMEFADMCKQKGIPFYFKSVYSGDVSKIDPMQFMRDESIVIYTSDRYLADYTNITNDIISRRGYKLDKPPVCTGALANNVGFGSEPKLNGRTSFNSLRSKVISRAMDDMMKSPNYIKYGKNYPNFYRDLRQLIVHHAGLHCISMDNFCLGG